MRILAFALIASITTGCAMVPKTVLPSEEASGYTYIPIDPFPVAAERGPNCAVAAGAPALPYAKLPVGLPDNAIRMLIEEFDGKGNVSYGMAKVSGENRQYRVTTDFISADTVNFPVVITKFARLRSTNDLEAVPFSQVVNSATHWNQTESYDVRRHIAGPPPNKHSQIFNIPIYVGIGLRATADITTLNSSANVSGIGVIGAEAEANNLKGSLIVQTLGVNGKAVTAALPIQSELNRTTAQNAIVAVASIKTLLHAAETETAPRVVGMYLPFPGGKPLVNAIISELSIAPPIWQRPCMTQ